MGAFIDLPTEVLTTVLRYVNLNGGLAQMRLVSSCYDMLICEEQHWYLHDILCRYEISERVMDLYNNGHGIMQSASELRHYLFFRREIAMLEALDLQLKELEHPAQPRNQEQNFITPLLLLSAFAGEFKSNVQREAGTKHPSYARVPFALMDTCHFSSGVDWELDEMEALISVTDRCASALWRVEPPNRHREFYVSSDRRQLQSCCTDVAYEGTQQALLTEFVLRNGPIWVAQILLSDLALLQDGSSGQYRPVHLLSFDGLRRTPSSVCARMVAGGLARNLWQLRSCKIYEEQERREERKLETSRTTDIRVNAAVWRGSAGDM